MAVQEVTPEAWPWLAAYTRPRFEMKVKGYYESCGIEVFVPTVPIRCCWSDRSRLLTRPLFPSYVFLRPDAGQRRGAVQSPGFLHFVRGQWGPAEIAEGELGAVRALLSSGMECNPLPGAELGREVEVVRGAMRGVRGYLMHKSRACMVLSITAAQGVRISFPDASWLRPLPMSPPCTPGDAAGTHKAQSPRLERSKRRGASGNAL